MSQTKIMIVEDEPITALDIRRQLKTLGYAVPALAALGEEVLDKVATTRPDLVLMDINLKGQMDGVAAAEQIRSVFNIPVIFLTAYSDEATLQRARVTEPSGYILKPFDPGILRTTIELALYRHRTEQKLAAIYSMGQELTLLHDEEVIIRRVLVTALDTLYAEWAGGGLIEETGNELKYYHYAAGHSPKVTELCLPLDDERQIGMGVICSGRAISISDIWQGSRYVPWAMACSGRSELCVPMRIGKWIIGVLIVASSQPDHFTPADQQLLQTLADQAAIVLENARLYCKEREQLERLRQSRSQLVQMEKTAAAGCQAAAIAREINDPIQAALRGLALLWEGIANQCQPEELYRYLDVTKNEVLRVAAMADRLRELYGDDQNGTPGCEAAAAISLTGRD